MPRRIVILFVAILGLAIAGCGSSDKTTGPDPTTAQLEVNAANAALAAGDYNSAYAHFQAALVADASNQEARFGVAVSGVYVVQNDPEIQQVVDYVKSEVPLNASRSGDRRAALAQRLGVLGATPTHDFGPRSMARAMVRVMGAATTDPVAVSQVQYLIRTKVLPRLLVAEYHLDALAAASEFVVKYPPAVTNLPDTIEIDRSDILLLGSIVNGVQGWLGMFVAYNWDVQNNDFEHVNAESLLAAGTAWAALNTGGADQLAAAKADLLAWQIRLTQAATSLATETDDQSDDIVSNTVLSEPQFVQLQQDAERVAASMQAPVQVQVDDHNRQPFNLQIELGRFFVPAIADLKTKLPDHAFDPQTGDPEPVLPLTFSDPTINGIFPDLTNARWQALTGLSGPPPGLTARRK